MNPKNGIFKKNLKNRLYLKNVHSGMVSGQKLACTGAAKELSGTPGRGSHAVA